MSHGLPVVTFALVSLWVSWCTTQVQILLWLWSVVSGSHACLHTVLPIGVQEQLGTALQALECVEKLHSNVTFCLQLVLPAINVSVH